MIIEKINKKWIKKQGLKATLIILTTPLFFHPTRAQSDLRSFLELAEKNYPAIAAKQAEAEAAQVKVSLEKNTLLPSLDAAYQFNYSTYNNITGMNYPATLLPISGPPSSDNNYDAVPGSAASLLLKWAPITFGQRSASIEYNRKLYERQLAGVKNEVLQVKFKVAFMYLEIAATGELIKAYQKNIERNEFNLRQVYTLVTTGIRPAVDSLKFKGELSKAKTELFRLNNLMETQKQELRELLVTEEPQDSETDQFFFQNLPTMPTDQSIKSADTTDSMNLENPALEMARYELEANKARLKQIDRSWTPKLELWGTTYARGSGISYDGEVNKSAGWSFSRYNYGVGLQVVFPILNLTDVRLRSHQQDAIMRASESYFNQTRIILNKQESIAISDLATALSVANEVPAEYEANASAFNALQTRYNAGLIDYTELIQAQYDLLNAESRLKNAYTDAWISLLKLAAVRGDMNIFLNQIQN